MKIEKKQLQILKKLLGKGTERRWLRKEDLVISLYLPDFWDGEFDDESLYYYRTSEYASAEAAFSLSMRLLLYAELVERKHQELKTELADSSTSQFYRITEAGDRELEKIK